VLAQVPLASQWTRGFTGGTTTSPEVFRRHSAPATVHAAVEGIAHACILHPDQMLYDLLAGAIGECATWAGPAAGRTLAATPRRGCPAPEPPLWAKARHAVLTLDDHRGGLTVRWINRRRGSAGPACGPGGLVRGWPEPGWRPPAPAWLGIGVR
jgi:hypothetical protein